MDENIETLVKIQQIPITNHGINATRPKSTNLSAMC